MMYHLLTKILEAKLPIPQQLLADKIGVSDELKISVDPDYPTEAGWRKFWLLSNGSLVSVKQTHRKTATEADVDYTDLWKTNAGQGYVYNEELGVVFRGRMTGGQIKALIGVYSKYHPMFLHLTTDSGRIVSRIKNTEHMEALLKYGKEFVLEATTADINRKQRSITRLFPTFPDRVRKVEDMGGLRLQKTDPNTWHFKVHSGTKKSTWYEAKLSFKNIIGTLATLVRDKRLWVEDRSRVDLKKLAREFAGKADVEVFCSCPAFLYWGPAYILTKKGAKYTNPENRPPVERNPKQYGAVCKHYHAVLKALPFYTTTIAKWLKDFHQKDIDKIEAEVKKEFGWIKPAVKALKGRKEEVEEPKEEPEETKESKVNEIADSAGIKALYKVYHNVERGIDPDPDDVYTALDMMKNYYSEYIGWYHKFPKMRKAEGVIYKTYKQRLSEIELAIESRNVGDRIVALDMAVNQWHRDYPAIAHLAMEVEDEPGSHELEGMIEEIASILSKLGRLPEKNPFAVI